MAMDITVDTEGMLERSITLILVVLGKILGLERTIPDTINTILSFYQDIM